MCCTFALYTHDMALGGAPLLSSTHTRVAQNKSSHRIIGVVMPRTDLALCGVPLAFRAHAPDAPDKKICCKAERCRRFAELRNASVIAGGCKPTLSASLPLARNDWFLWE